MQSEKNCMGWFLCLSGFGMLCDQTSCFVKRSTHPKTLDPLMCFQVVM
jgi:hypothetical protein